MKHKEGYREPTDYEWEFLIPNGKEFELCTPKGWVVGTFPKILDNNPELDEFKPDDKMRLAHANIRVKI